MAADGKQHGPEFAPRLPIYSLPTQKLMEISSIPAGMVTPPLHPPVSVPFQWEEEPGRPRPWVARASSVARRCLVLDLPPRLMNNSSSGGGSNSQRKNLRAPSFSQGDVVLDDDNSPTSVLLDPYEGGPSAESPTAFAAVDGDPYGASRAKALDCGSGRGGGGKGGGRIDQWLMGLWLRRNWAGKGEKAAAVAAGGEDARFRLVGGGGDAAASAAGENDGGNKAKITRFSRKRSFTASQFVASIYGSFKHMVSPRRRKATTNSKVPHAPLLLPSIEANEQEKSYNKL
ncbi:uncharacterized protein LOC116266638 [Nymphaea colorata]|nr:uncharacterized protein LOC116266638 [Nymphaea colorata]XP_031503799.1 uncharacterized protein LOC116266638 [Nymphaea colorata]